MTEISVPDGYEKVDEWQVQFSLRVPETEEVTVSPFEMRTTVHVFWHEGRSVYDLVAGDHQDVPLKYAKKQTGETLSVTVHLVPVSVFLTSEVFATLLEEVDPDAGEKYKVLERGGFGDVVTDFETKKKIFDDLIYEALEQSASKALRTALSKSTKTAEK